MSAKGHSARRKQYNLNCYIKYGEYKAMYFEQNVNKKLTVIPLTNFSNKCFILDGIL